MTGEPSAVADWLRVARIHQWTKNGLLFAGFLFAGRLRGPEVGAELSRVVLAFASFCLLSSATYILNDYLDLAQDREHPVKRQRPLAAGRISAAAALAAMTALAAVGLGAAGLVSRLSGWSAFLQVAVVYVVLTVSYSLFFKHKVMVDVIVLALGFVVRVVAGCVAIPVDISHWIVVCTFLLAMFMGFCKRRHELLLMGANCSMSRPVLPKYSAQLLDQLITASLAATVMSYTLYTMEAEHKLLPHSQDAWLLATIPVVVYGLFRFLYLVYRKDLGGSPEKMFQDGPLLAALVLWAAMLVTMTFGVGAR